MSSGDDTDNQRESRVEALGVAMGYLLAKGYYRDKSRSGISDDAQVDSRIVSEARDTESPSDPVEDLSSSSSPSTPPDTRLVINSSVVIFFSFFLLFFYVFPSANCSKVL